MVTEVGAAISDWDRDGRMWWLALAGKTRRSHASRLSESLYMRIITSRKLLHGIVFKKADVVTGQICCKYFQSLQSFARHGEALLWLWYN